MLEKIGLPPKPSQRGNNWVVDASHCQGCSSQFTFINRKHHCRRCGGLLCNSCTSQRMVLRGQGDSPVRICQPCKTLEEAARFELRYGNRARAAKASTKPSPKSEDEILSDILGNDKMESLAMGSSSKTVSSVERATSLIPQEKPSFDGGEKVNRSASLDVYDGQATEKEPASPEDLRRQAVEEKKKYRVLKGDGKSDEALKAFKRGKELERQADALEISIRKNRRKALVSQNVEEGLIKDDAGGSRRGNKVARVEGKEKDNLAAELRELGWSDKDLQTEDKKKTNTSLEGEFSSLLGEVLEKTKTGKGGNLGIDKSKVLAIKKRALELKREGNLAEAKEELKRAKVLEKQLEEQELLAGAEDSDDELSVLLRSLDSDNQDLSVDQYEQRPDFDISSLLVDADQIMNGNFDVTEEDMEDPEMAAALNSLGWADDDHDSNVPAVNLVDKEALLKEILSLKREALTQKRAGNVSEAMSLLKKAKLLEKDLNETSELREGDFTKDSTSQVASRSSAAQTVPSNESLNAVERFESKPAPRKSKMMVQKELISLKKKALALKREGRLEEAEEELKKGKILEQQLEEMDKAPTNTKAMPGPTSTKPPNLVYDNLPGEDEVDENVTDQDMNDPSYLSLLKNLGWQEEQNDPPANISSGSRKIIDSPPPVIESVVARRRKSRAELQRELLGLKRRALVLRRQGESEEAEEVARKTKDIEAQIAELDNPTTEAPQSSDKDGGDAEMVTEKDMHDPTMLSVLKDLGWNDAAQETFSANENSKENASKSAVYSDATSVTVKRSKGEIQRELLNLKRRGLALRRKGEIEEAEELQNMAKVLEAQLEELEAPKQLIDLQEATKDDKPINFGPNSNSETLANLGIINSDPLIPLNLPPVESTAVPPPTGNSENLIDLLTGDNWVRPQTSPEKLVNQSNPIKEHAPFSSNNDVETDKRGNISQTENPAKDHASPTNTETSLKQEILARKRKALAFKREGKLIEAREELRQAKLLENRGSQNDPEPKTSPGPGPTHDSAASSSSMVPPKPLSSRDRFKLQQESLAHKRQAMKLRREGRTEEADAEFELAKSLEARLEESAPNDGAEANDDSLGVEDFLDPQLLSALKAIGIDDARAAPPIPDRPQTSKPIAAAATSESPDRERRTQLEEQIKAEKIKAIHLKRSGKQTEALDALRHAKLLEKKLNSFS